MTGLVREEIDLPRLRYFSSAITDAYACNKRQSHGQLQAPVFARGIDDDHEMQSGYATDVITIKQTRVTGEQLHRLEGQGWQSFDRLS